MAPTTRARRHPLAAVDTIAYSPARSSLKRQRDDSDDDEPSENNKRDYYPALTTDDPPHSEEEGGDGDDECDIEEPVFDEHEEALSLADESPGGELEEDDDELIVLPPEEEEDEEEQEDDRSDEEVEMIQYEMAQLEQAVPALHGHYQLIDRLGEGTFSSVYKAIDLNHADYDNTYWTTPLQLIPTDPVSGEADPDNAFETPQALSLRRQAASGKVYVALKRIYVTSSPERIQNELDILNDLRMSTNIAYLIEAIRHEDQVIAVMPYNRHQDFRSYYKDATLPFLRSYFACLLRALVCTHNLHIIHRDVKPANFLFDVLTGTGTLCDFGLAQKIAGNEFLEWRAECTHSLPGPSVGGRRGCSDARKSAATRAPGVSPGLASGLHGVRLARPLSLARQLQAQMEQWSDLRKRCPEDATVAEIKQINSLRPLFPEKEYLEEISIREREKKDWYKSWNGVRATPNAEAEKSKRPIGVLKEDRRQYVRANRAGTRGFRAPEVLFKCPDQTVALDIWSVGIMMLCFLTRRFPFFNSNDDTEALAELAAIFGKPKMERVATLHNRNFLTNIPDYNHPLYANFHDLVKQLNPLIIVENSPDPLGLCPSTKESDDAWYPESELYFAVDMMKRCLELDCTKRWTAEELLEHPFFDGLFDLGGGKTGPRGPLHSKVSDWY